MQRFFRCLMEEKVLLRKSKEQYRLDCTNDMMLCCESAPIGGESEAFALTLVDRLMNTEEMYETLDDITTILRTASYFNNFDDSAKEMFKVKYENNTSPLISMLYGIIKHSIEETS